MQITPFKYFFSNFPYKSIIIIILIFFSGLFEAFSFAAILPLISVLFKDSISSSDGIIIDYINNFILFFNINYTLINILIIIIFGFIAKSILSFLAMQQTGFVCAEAETLVRQDLSNALLNTKWSFFNENKIGNLSTAFSPQTEVGANVYRVSFLVITDSIHILIFLLMALTLSATVTIVSIVFGVIMMFSLRYFVKIAGFASKLSTKHMASLISKLIEGLSGLKSIKAMSAQDNLEKYLSKDIYKIQNLRKKIIISSSVLKNIQEPAIILGLSILVFYLFTFLENNQSSAILLMVLFYRCLQKLLNLQIYYQQIAVAIPAFNFIQKIIYEATNDREDINAGKKITFKKDINFENVSFKYNEKNVLSNLTFKINAFEIIAILGESGSGKTTIIDLISGLTKLQKGDIKIDGNSIRSINLSNWRSQIGYVPQDPFMIHDSILNNITLENHKYTNQDVDWSLEKSGTKDFISAKAEGVYFDIGEFGSKLSGGQKQRLAIARAIIRKPKILILDEPTSALDSVSAARIKKTLQELQNFMTIIIITHQEDLADIASKIIRIKHGEITS